MSAPLAILNFKATSNPAAAIRYFADPKKVTARFDGLTTGVAVGTPKQLAELLLSAHHNKRAKRVCRTAVISVQTPKNATQDQLEDIDKRLLEAARDLQKILKIVSMLGWVHGNTATRHLHLIFPNSTGRRTLDLNPKLLRELQGFTWTSAFLSGRGRGRRKALPIYPKARKLVVRDLAQVLVDSQGNISEDQWDALVAEGKISDFRRRKDGSIVSFEWEKQRVRVSTLKGFIAEQNTQPTIKMYETSIRNIVNNPGSQSLPGPIPQPQSGPVPTAIPQTTGPGQLKTLPNFEPTKPSIVATFNRVAGTLGVLEQALIAKPNLNEGPQSGTPEFGAIDQNSLSAGGLAGRGRRFKRRSIKQPAVAETAVNSPGLTPKFKRPNGPSIGF